MGEETEPKWEGKVAAGLTGPTADQIWPLLSDFCNFHKWNPNLETCYQVEGNLGQPGLIRYCASSSVDGGTMWCKEKLLMIDPINRCFSYEILDNNLNFKSYVATMKLLPIEGGCQIEWAFTADPVQGWRLEDMVSVFESCIQFMAKQMEEAVRSCV